MYYKVLAEAIGAEAHIAFAPQHLFIRHRDERDPAKWVNVELTTPIDFLQIEAGCASESGSAHPACLISLPQNDFSSFKGIFGTR